MKRFKKIIFTVFLFILVFAFAGCGGNGETTDQNRNDEPKVEAYKVTWKNFDGTVLKVDENISKGTTPSYKGDAPIRPSNDEYEYTFTGWDPAIGVVNADVTYTAEFSQTAKTYTITFDTDGGSQMDNITLAWGSEVTISEPTKTGYTFIGWNQEFSGVMPKENITLKALWAPIEYTITFNTGSSFVIEPIKLHYGDPIVKPQNPQKDFHDFSGWDPELPATMSAENLNVSAVWAPKEYTITFNTNGGTAVNKITLPFGSTVPKPANPTKEGNTFAGWDVAIPDVMPTENITINAKWTVNSYIITFVTGEGSTQIAPMTVKYGDAITPPADPSKPSYLFNGWEPQLPLTMPANNITVNAVWELNSFTLSFNSDGGSQVIPVTGEKGMLINEPSKPTKTDYVFLGWFLDVERTQPVEWPITLTKTQTIYAGWNIRVPYATYLQALFDSYKINPHSFIPEKMLGNTNLITPTQQALDLSLGVNVSDIPYGGYGEQWQMVLTNIDQSQTFFNVLTVVDTLVSASVTAFNNHIDSNPQDSASHTFKEGIYNVTIYYRDNTINYILDYTNTFPMFGEQTVQIALSYNIETLLKVGRIQIGDANALRYESTNTSYKFGIRYGGVRRAYFEIEQIALNQIEGRIFEYLGVDGVYSHGSAAQFFSDGEYVTVVGNKASGMLGWTGTLNELYLVSEGKLLGYEVREELSVAGLTETYNTLWLNLTDTLGINMIKVIKNEETPLPPGKNPHFIYLNGEATAFATKDVGGFNLKRFSRRYDIELRKQYFYIQEGTEFNVVELEVPMLFVQEEQYDNLISDVKAQNAYLSSFNVTIQQSHLNRIKEDYQNRIDPFILQKDEHTVDTILTYIGEKYIHA
jgi:uncharacterized repeat protein (TIGR02543 family)